MRVIKVHYCNHCPFMSGFDPMDNGDDGKEVAFCAHKRMTQLPFDGKDRELGRFKRLTDTDLVEKWIDPTEPMIEIPANCPI